MAIQHSNLNGSPSTVDHTAIVIGAGLSGIRMLYELRKRGIDGKCFERGSGLGGTWFWNRYPGARADSEAWVYIFTFLEEIGMEWKWKERFPTQPELERYLNEVVDYLQLRNQIEFNTDIAAAHFDEAQNIWEVNTTAGASYTSKFLVAASGALSTPLKPPYPGLEDFKGEWYHTGLWPDRKIDFAGKRVGIIGTGATAVQAIPIIAHVADHVTVFQRTPNYVLPARNFIFTEEQEREIKQDFKGVVERARNQSFGTDILPLTRSSLDIGDRAALDQVFDYGWERGGFRFMFETVSDIMTDSACNEAACEFLRKKIRAIVHDPAVAETLSPRYPLLSKRPPLGHFYYETFNRPNVELVDLKENPIQEFTADGLRTLSKEHKLDMVIFAIGFDVSTGALNAMDIRGVGGKSLKDHLGSDLETAYGITMTGFPNLFMILGPLSPFANLPIVIDATADWIGKTLEHMRTIGRERIDTNPKTATYWTKEVDREFYATVLPEGAKQVGSWYVGGNVENKAIRCYWYFGGVPRFIEHCDKEISLGHPGYTFSAPVQPTAA